MMSNQIPKVIHYCWFGGNPKSEIILKCISSWKKFCPEYQIVEWNEQNFDVNAIPFMRDAYRAKKWAFVSDVARLKILYEHGGIYMDTDVELLSQDPFFEHLTHNAFFFVSTACISTGLGFGCRPKDDLLAKLLSSYEHVSFDLNNLYNITCPMINKPVLMDFFPHLISAPISQTFDNYAFISENIFWKSARHYGTFTWRNAEQDHALQYAKKTFSVSKLRRRLQNPAIFMFFQKHNWNRMDKLYSFLVHDLFDYGLRYWFMKILIKIKVFFHRA